MQPVVNSAVDSVYQLALAGDVPGIQSILETESATNEERPDLLWEEDEIGRNALSAATMVGRCNVVRELVKHGADVNTWTVRGRHYILQVLAAHECRILLRINVQLRLHNGA